ncbi:hypothetical protein HUN07_15290 [Rhodococcus sp. W8901]|nr:hypothetical protein HUN07_15290 [Rhodococcus sp. W8901]
MLVGKRKLASRGVLALPALLLTTACGAQVEDSVSVDTTSPATPMSCQQFESFSGHILVGNPPAAATLAPAMPLQPGEEPTPPPARPSVVSIKIEQAAGVDAIVFSLSGDGYIGWTARFVQMPLLQGTDDPVSISGSCILQIDMIGVDSNIVSLRREMPKRLLPESDESSVVEVLSYPSANGLAQAFVGTRSGTPAVTVDALADRPAITVGIAS